MAPKVENKKCTKCSKVLSRSGKSLECYKCNKSLHLKCSRLDKKRFLKYIQGNLEFLCQFRINYTCYHCNKHVYYGHKAILCDSCQNWTHKKCAGLTIHQHSRLSEKSDETWYCRPCKSQIFPFFSMSNYQLCNLINYTKKTSKEMKNTCDPLTLQKYCSVSLKKNNKIGIKCSSCKQNIHKKCSRLKQSEILDLANCNFNFECTSCLTDKFLFVLQDNLGIQKQSFNSNFLCKCQKTLHSDIHEHKYIFNYKFSNSDKNNENNIVDFNDKHLDNLVTQPDFKYYQSHEFHKLNQNLNIDKNFSLMHANICSIGGNIGKLETLLINLGHNFDALALSETWTKTIDKTGYVIDGYQTFHDTGGQSLKSGCVFFVKEGLKYKQQTGLEMNLKDENNEFQSC